MSTSGTPWFDGPPPPAPSRLVVLAPHPDDEIFGAAGLMSWARDHGSSVEIVALTDGEASHAASVTVNRERLRALRIRERRRALVSMNLSAALVHRLRLADGGLPGVGIEKLAGLIVRAISLHDSAPRTVIAVPSRHDAHPDHRAAHQAGVVAGVELRRPVWEYAVWARAENSWEPALGRVLYLGPDVHRRKLTAVRAFGSQLRPMGPDPATDGPVLGAATVAAFAAPTERVRLP